MKLTAPCVETAVPAAVPHAVHVERNLSSAISTYNRAIGRSFPGDTASINDRTVEHAELTGLSHRERSPEDNYQCCRHHSAGWRASVSVTRGRTWGGPGGKGAPATCTQKNSEFDSMFYPIQIRFSDRSLESRAWPCGTGGLPTSLDSRYQLYATWSQVAGVERQFVTRLWILRTS
jgi:hypothetical protein